MSSIPPSFWLYCACAVFALVARISVEGLESGNGALDRLPYLSLVLVSCLASAAALYFAGPETQKVGPQIYSGLPCRTACNGGMDGPADDMGSLIASC
jgi:hypothetical protein